MRDTYLTRLRLKYFTAFEELDLEFSPDVNIFIGANGTGKTHLLKLLYSACDITKTGEWFAKKIIRVFLPYENSLGRLVSRRPAVSKKARVIINRGTHRIGLTFSNHHKEPIKARHSNWFKNKMESAYIPVKEMLANAPGFRSLYATREVHFEEVYADIVDRAFLPILKGPIARGRKKLLTVIQKQIEGRVIQKNEEFFLKNKQGELEFTLLAEGIRKLALLWLLIQNGTLLKGSILFWDEPEANLNPAMMGTVVDILLELHRLGVQIFLATHDYVLLKEFDLRTNTNDSIRFHSLYRDPVSVSINVSSADHYLDIDPNMILDTFHDLFVRDVNRSLASGERE